MGPPLSRLKRVVEKTNSLLSASQGLASIAKCDIRRHCEKRSRSFKGSHQGRRYSTFRMALKASKAIVPALVGSMVVSYIFWDLARNRKVFGGTVPRTLTKEWLQETERRMDEGWPTVAGKPVVMNPITRQNYRPTGDS